MSYSISPRDLGKITLNARDTVSSVLQNIAVILSTRQGTVPLYREFGLPMRFVDKPISAAKPLMIAEIEDAIRDFEPRAIVKRVSFAMDESAPGKLIPTVEVEIHDG